VPAPASPEPAWDLASISISSSWCQLVSPEFSQQRHFSLHAETRRPREEHLRKLVAILAPIYKLAQRWF
jgi:hypothetical protein